MEVHVYVLMLCVTYAGRQLFNVPTIWVRINKALSVRKVGEIINRHYHVALISQYHPLLMVCLQLLIASLWLVLN